ncbi:MAG TPA: hypothetical protein DIW31_11310 [Bacteroidales bacterium]|nr:hypothetical protein [Bacteroidales bacterium]
MKQKIIIWASVVLLLVVVAFMVMDFFFQPKSSNENPYEYKLDKLKYIDTSLIKYKPFATITPDLKQIHAICIDKNDDVYIAGDGVKIFDSDLKSVSNFADGKEVRCIAIADGNIYLGIQDHIEIFDAKGKSVTSWKAVNEKSVLTSIAISDKFVYVADAGNRIVYQYNKLGELVKEIGKKNAENGIQGFVIPSPYFDLLIGREGELWVVNPGRHQFESYNENGDQISSWAKTSMSIEGFSGCCNPSNIAMLSDGSFVTSEKGIERVKIHHPWGEFNCVVASPENFVEGTQGIDLAVDSKDRIYVLDPEKKEINIYTKK